MSLVPSFSRVVTNRSCYNRIKMNRNVSTSLILLSHRRTSSSQTNTSSAPSNATILTTSVDPQAMASEFIQKSSNARIPGTEAIQSYLTPEQKRANYLMAMGLMGFVAWVFSYSLYAVGGKSDKGLPDDTQAMNLEQILRSEAHEAQTRKIQEQYKEKQVRELVALDEELAQVEGNMHSSLGIVQKIQSLEGTTTTESSLSSDTTPSRRGWKLMFWKKE